MDIVVISLGVFQAVAGFVFILFLPGYALCWALYPRKEELTFMGRMSLSLTLSLSAVILTSLFIDLVLGIDTTPINIAISLIVLTALAATVWKLETAYPEWAVKQKFEKKMTAHPNLLNTQKERLQSALIDQQQKLQRFLTPAKDDHEE
ncbi:DUF1616 domain-containing protein [Methanocalculus sp.]|uniref:DUF1616 domain-containing protein n=1 Tax=Methanocalculus sp. TaxID=2004547 RepID=UPI00261E8F3F|nr:DUF1616 domain-containing protein [Methanocalculus sp.]MDG6251628.1 DUF1616 domain-containing protein [Methanocalculus sp.]